MGRIEWTEPSGPVEAGVDHLGLRYAGEQAYSQFIDFTTTVAWRPRYFSFFSWATRKAFLAAGGNEGSVEDIVDANVYFRNLKSMEYAMAAGTLLNDPSAQRIAGSNKINDALQEAKNQGNMNIKLRGDHLASKVGGFGIYAGLMRLLNITESSEGIDRPVTGSAGYHLADLFEKNYSFSGISRLKPDGKLSFSELLALGRCCSLSQLNEQANIIPGVEDERDLLREIVLHWGGFRRGKGPSARRILSIGLILETRKLLADEPASLNSFRELTLLGATRSSGSIRKLELPDIYSNVLKEWSLYQTHAYTTYALEALLGVILAYAKDLGDIYGALIPYKMLLSEILMAISRGVGESNLPLPREFDNWTQLTLGNMKDKLVKVVAHGRNTIAAEPECLLEIEKNVNKGHSAQPSRWAHDAAFMLILSIVRQSLSIDRNGKDTWLGDIDSMRLPPNFLKSHLERALDADMLVTDYLELCLRELVVQQHRSNALRKLATSPSMDTAKFFLQGPYFNFLSLHHPGTSNPRFMNAVIFLQDLGYLTDGNNPTITKDGEEILSFIARGGK